MYLMMSSYATFCDKLDIDYAEPLGLFFYEHKDVMKENEKEQELAKDYEYYREIIDDNGIDKWSQDEREKAKAKLLSDALNYSDNTMLYSFYEVASDSPMVKHTDDKLYIFEKNTGEIVVWHKDKIETFNKLKDAIDYCMIEMDSDVEFFG